MPRPFRASATFEAAAARAATALRRGGETRARTAKSASSTGEAPCTCTGVWRTSPADGNRWVAVEVSAGRAVLEGGASSGLAVALRSGRRIEIGHWFDAPTLVQLLDVLERL